MSYKYVQGKFRPKNPQKYQGNLDNLVFRSSWERTLYNWFDETDEVIKWHSECDIIPYISPLDGRQHRYFVDARVQLSDGRIILIEVKPKAQTLAPKKTASKSEGRFLREVATYSVNQAKWAAARHVCEKYGWQFMIFTEDQLKPKARRYKKKSD
jgi:hypothetical protein